MLTMNINRFGGMTLLAFTLLFIFLPTLVFSAESPDSANDKTGITYECATEVNGVMVYGECTFQDLIAAVKKVVDIAVKLALSLSVIAITYAGFLYMKSGDNPGDRKRANKMLLNVVKGIVFILAAWLIVSLIANALLRPGVVQFGM